MVVRKQFSLSIDLDALRRSSQEERQRALASPLISLSPEHERELEEFQSLSIEEAQERHKSLSKEVMFQLSLLGTREQAEDPYWFSDLPKWLEFETWKPRDAMLLLSGVSPAAALARRPESPASTTCLWFRSTKDLSAPGAASDGPERR